MRRSLYKQVAAALCIPVSAWPHLELTAQRYDITAEAAVSIYSQETQLRVVHNFHRLKAAGVELVKRYLVGEDIVELAFRLDFPPCLVVRQLLSHLLGVSKQATTEALKDPSQLRRLRLPADGLQVEGHPIDGALMTRLESDLQRCVDNDWLYSPRMDAIRHTTGLEAEAVLCAGLAAAEVPFWSEEALREAGYIKTPDVRLQVPMALPNGAIVNWIDSKATFGDENQHRQQLQDQFCKYINRYGPGAVIYWSGHIADLTAECLQDVTLLSDLPKHMRQLPCLPVTACDA